MLLAAAFVPSAPLLLPALGGGPADLRSACLQAISGLPGEIVVLGGALETGSVTGSVDATPYGGLGPAPADGLPLSLSVGASLLADRSHRLMGLGSDADAPAVAAALAEGDVSFVVVADGTAKRTEKGPGHLDPRAEDFDREVERALAAVDTEALLRLDPVLAAELWVGSVVGWQVAAAAVSTPMAGRVGYAAAPYGVGYVVARWDILSP